MKGVSTASRGTLGGFGGRRRHHRVAAQLAAERLHLLAQLLTRGFNALHMPEQVVQLELSAVERIQRAVELLGQLRRAPRRRQQPLRSRAIERRPAILPSAMRDSQRPRTNWVNATRRLGHCKRMKQPQTAGERAPLTA